MAKGGPLKYEFSDLCLDTGRRQLSRGDEQLKLTKLSFKLLAALVAAAPDMVTHDELVEKVWGPERIISPENISQRVAMVRQSLGDSPDNPTYIETVYGQGFRLMPDVVVSSAAAVEPQQSTANGRHLIAWMVGAVLIAALVWVMRDVNDQPTAQLVDTDIRAPTTIAVLPFVNMSNDPQQEIFVDGLTEEVLNSLVKVNGLLVTGRTSSFVYRDQAQDLREIGTELDVDYLLEGSVRKDGDQIRVTAQLIDVATGAHLSSSVYDRDISDVFAVQREISEQVAAELKISLIHRDDQYNTALARLDAIAIEQLFAARAQIAEYAGIPVRKALDSLENLDSRYPDTPEIMGLIARGYMIYGSTGDISDLEEMIDYVQLSRATLVLDPTNLDALMTLAVTEDDFAMHRTRAVRLYRDLIRFHPGRAEHYSMMLGYLFRVYTPCEQIKSFIDSVPAGVLSTNLLTRQQGEYEACTNEPWTSSYSDDSYLSFVRQVERNPNQRYLSRLFMEQLRMGAWAAAKETELRIDYAVGSWWVSYAAAYKDLYDQPSDQPVEKFLEFFVQTNYGSYDRPASFLVHRGILDENFDSATEYLGKLPEFPVEVATRKSSLGLMMLQHRAGQIGDSTRTAERLAKAMSHYLVRSPGSYRYYNLAKFHLVSAVYVGDFDAAQQILNTGFAEDHPYWQDDIAAVRTVLSPWMQHPVVAEYVDRIEADRERARDKFGLQ